MQNLKITGYKPHKLMNYTGQENSREQKRNVRYKHYEQMDDKTLKAYSIARAYKKTQNSSKMHLLRAIPLIATTLIGTSLALSQPGKLSAKAAIGLGFLTLAKSTNEISDVVDEVIDEKFVAQKQDKNTNIKKNLLKLGATLTTVLAVAGAGSFAVKNGKKLLTKIAPKTTNFFKGEVSQLTREINNTKLGKFVENTVNPFVEKHENKINLVADVMPFISAFGAVKAQGALTKSISKDFAKNALDTFEKGKMVQQIAKERYDSVDAEEI